MSLQCACSYKAPWKLWISLFLSSHPSPAGDACVKLGCYDSVRASVCVSVCARNVVDVHMKSPGNKSALFSPPSPPPPPPAWRRSL